VKAVLIVHSAAIDVDVNELLKSVGIDAYTRFTDVVGRGHRSEPHLNTDVWPGANSATLAVVDEDKARAAMECVRAMRKTLGSEGIKAFLWEIQDIT
jgi:hypothetical protein